VDNDILPITGQAKVMPTGHILNESDSPAGSTGAKSDVYNYLV